MTEDVIVVNNYYNFTRQLDRHIDGNATEEYGPGTGKWVWLGEATGPGMEELGQSFPAACLHDSSQIVAHCSFEVRINALFLYSHDVFSSRFQASVSYITCVC